MKITLRKKFLIPTLFFVALGMFVSTLLSYENSKDALENVIREQINGLADAIVGQMDSWLDRLGHDVEVWGEFDTYQSELAMENSNAGYDSSSAGFASEQLVQNKSASRFYEFLGLANLSGTVYVTSEPESVKKTNVADQEFFQQSLKGELFISDVFKSERSSNPVFIVSTPVYGIEEFGTESTNDIVGVLYAVVDLPVFSKSYIETIDAGKTGFAFIYNKDGSVVAHSDPTQVFGLDLKSHAFGETMMKQKQGILVYEFAGNEKIAAYRTIGRTGWGVVVGVDIEEVFTPVNNMRLINFWLAIGITVLLALSLWFICGKLVINPISKVIGGLKDIAQGEGDLTSRLRIGGADEVGELSGWFNTFLEKLQKIIREIRENADSLTASSVELSQLSGTMSHGAETMSNKSGTVVSAAEEMSVNINSVATATEQASSNMNLVAAAAEQMTATINEIAKNSEKARAITNEAVSQSDDASRKIDELGRAAQEIGKVTEAITDISEQTNLLALNATIEAARAGETGKGFAVVANEIKELARQTAEATQDIKERIDSIQSSTAMSVTQVEEISKVINEVNDIVRTIATAVEEQSVTTREIAGNVSQASGGIREVSERVTESSNVAGGIAGDIAEVNQSCSEMSNSGAQVNMSARELAGLATRLKDLVGKFKVGNHV